MIKQKDMESKEVIDAEFARLRKIFKTMSKNQLIALLLQQVEQAVHQQNINKVLLEQIKNQDKEKQEEGK